MDMTTLSLDGLRSLHEGIRRALATDDAAKSPKPYGVREFPGWREWATALEAELDRRNEPFSRLQW